MVHKMSELNKIKKCFGVINIIIYIVYTIKIDLSDNVYKLN